MCSAHRHWKTSFWLGIVFAVVTTVAIVESKRWIRRLRSRRSSTAIRCLYSAHRLKGLVHRRTISPDIPVGFHFLFVLLKFDRKLIDPFVLFPKRWIYPDVYIPEPTLLSPRLHENSILCKTIATSEQHSIGPK